MKINFTFSAFNSCVHLIFLLARSTLAAHSAAFNQAEQGMEVLHGTPARWHGISVREAADRRQAVTSRPDTDKRAERVPPEGRAPKTPPSLCGANCSADSQAHRAKSERHVQKQTQVSFHGRNGAKRRVGQYHPINLGSKCKSFLHSLLDRARIVNSLKKKLLYGIDNCIRDIIPHDLSFPQQQEF